MDNKKTTVGQLVVYIPVILALMGQDDWSKLAQQIIDTIFNGSTPLASMAGGGVALSLFGLAHKGKKVLSR